MNTLKIIQTLAKMGKIFSKIIRVCCVIGFCGCIVGIAVLGLGIEAMEVAGMDFETILVVNAEMTVGDLYAAMAAGLFLCAGEWVLTGYALRYFTNELAAGTPFTEDGAKELMGMGIRTIVIPLVALILAQIAASMFTHFSDATGNLSLDNGDSVALGIMFIIGSLLCRHGAELQDQTGPDGAE